MLKRYVVALLVFCLVAGFMGVAGAAYGTQTMPQNPTMMKKMDMSQVNLRDGMRKLWSDHVIWTRLFIISAVADMPETNLNAERLLQNQKDIGNAIKPYYGEAAGEKLAELLKTHILIAADIVQFAKAGKTGDMSDAERKWMINADEIAAFLSSANPGWTVQDLKDMLYQHLSLTKSELLARLNKDYPGDIKNFDAIYMQALMMADTLSNGVMKQFPDKFESK